MNIIVFIKQVPSTQDVKIDPKTGSMMRWAASTKMNPFDLVALEAALRLKDTSSAKVSVLTMGPDQAKSVLIEALAMGADEAFLISDRAFAGADVLATSHTLAYALESLHQPYDLVLCGQQTTDGDTAQVGPSIAALLKLPHVSFVKAMTNQATTVTVDSVTNDDHIRAQVKKPSLLTIDKDYAQPRYPSYWRLKENKDKFIKIITVVDLTDPDTLNHIGQLGSPTSVKQIFAPIHNVKTQKISGKPSEIAHQLVNYLKEEHLIERISHE